ncbi:hypothetical protein [Streptomyces formicae]|uniref:hypothetical protein n=1 Tax=Streptomyces formicae TaxID=1616117 RepID=UPI0036148B90
MLLSLAMTAALTGLATTLPSGQVHAAGRGDPAPACHNSGRWTAAVAGAFAAPGDGPEGAFGAPGARPPADVAGGPTVGTRLRPQRRPVSRPCDAPVRAEGALAGEGQAAAVSIRPAAPGRRAWPQAPGFPSSPPSLSLAYAGSTAGGGAQNAAPAAGGRGGAGGVAGPGRLWSYPWEVSAAFAGTRGPLPGGNLAAPCRGGRAF